MAINVTKREPCPICGKPDYCFWSDNNERGIRYLFCHRIPGSYGEIVGMFVVVLLLLAQDGKAWKILKLTPLKKDKQKRVITNLKNLLK